ncbi:hypothetical protein [Pseudocitrobacter sp. MW920760]
MLRDQIRTSLNPRPIMARVNANRPSER